MLKRLGEKFYISELKMILKCDFNLANIGFSRELLKKVCPQRKDNVYNLVSRIILYIGLK
jgi:hypothetical protein